MADAKAEAAAAKAAADAAMAKVVADNAAAKLVTDKAIADLTAAVDKLNKDMASMKARYNAMAKKYKFKAIK